MKTILCTGSQGYVGSVLTGYLQSNGYHVVGLDAGWFADCALAPNSGCEQYVADFRDVGPGIFKGVDAVIHLAALSNDPLGELDADLTHEINHLAAARFAAAAGDAGVPRFLFASSQSIYGVDPSGRELDEDATKGPVTAYGWSKYLAEQSILALNDEKFCTVALRPATVFGASPRLRCDVVFNNLLARAYAMGKVVVNGDGSESRPVVHVLDLCRAFVLALEAPDSVVGGRAYNVTGGNYTVKQLAGMAAALVGGSEVVYGVPSPDVRSYRTSPHRILTDLAWLPTVGLHEGGEDLLDFFGRVGLTEGHVLNECNRLARLRALLHEGKLDKELRCVSSR